ncbi:MAG TPA: sigma-54 dependent transcriptional regulator, partial [Pyrinomonadaceae bacterium]|nr:sigma-54 dependent transcriptional regulator [Pyrinomonadaceae bacterium]
AALSRPETRLLLAAAGTDTAQLVDAIKSHPSEHDVPVLVYLSQPGPDALESVLPEVDDFLLSPLSLRDLRLRVNRLIFGRDSSTRAQENLFSDLAAQQFIGSAPSFLAVVEKIPRFASCDATVLLVGATGTGKELCARAIHYLSARAKKPFMPVNCGSIPPDLFESEMFGHEQGAFTDARQARRGLLSQAEGGTLFLDEVDSLAQSAQVKLLRVLQERQYRPLGGQYRRADMRVIAATNQNLHTQMQAGAFREDLFYRLNVVTLNLPALRDRSDDIVPLAMHFMKIAGQEYGRSVKDLSAGAIQKLNSYAWPGNVRELENVIRQAVILGQGQIIRARDLQIAKREVITASPAFGSLKASKAHLIEEFERNYLEEAMVACSGNISKAARLAGKDRRTFFALLKKYGIGQDHTSLVESQAFA